MVGDPLGQEAPEILGTNARGHLVKLLLGPYGAREHAGCYIHDLYDVYDLYDLAHVCRVGAVKFASSATCFLGWDLYCTDAAQHLKAA